MRILILVLALVMTGCAAKKSSYVAQNKYADIEPVERITTPAPRLPETPTVFKVSTDKNYAALDLEGLNKLIRYREAAEYQQEALDDMIKAYNSLADRDALAVKAIRTEESRANYAEQKVDEMKQTLQKERRQRWFEVVLYRVGLAALVVLKL